MAHRCSSAESRPWDRSEAGCSGAAALGRSRGKAARQDASVPQR